MYRSNPRTAARCICSPPNLEGASQLLLAWLFGALLRASGCQVLPPLVWQTRATGTPSEVGPFGDQSTTGTSHTSLSNTGVLGPAGHRRQPPRGRIGCAVVAAQLVLVRLACAVAMMLIFSCSCVATARRAGGEERVRLSSWLPGSFP
jgi:hypothetical protein